jgi:hypothetical protein
MAEQHTAIRINQQQLQLQQQQQQQQQQKKKPNQTKPSISHTSPSKALQA